jgi:hypothetical protein
VVGAEERVRGVVGDDAPVLEHVPAVRDAERHGRVLLDDENGRALAVDGLDDVEDLVDEKGDSPIDGSSIRRRRGRAMSARPIASICCSPPDSVPPSWPARSPRRGNRP